jgi:anthranilate phosphoribosyltransferase
LRKKLGGRTIFNLLGPLLNPANAEYQLLGVGRPEMLDPLAGAAKLLGVRQAFLVCGQDGLDEVSLSAPTQVRRVGAGEIESMRWAPDDFDLEPVQLTDLRADGPQESAEIIVGILQGQDGSSTRLVLANAAAALTAAERVATLRDGVRKAELAIESGAAMRLLQQLRDS